MLIWLRSIVDGQLSRSNTVVNRRSKKKKKEKEKQRLNTMRPRCWSSSWPGRWSSSGGWASSGWARASVVARCPPSPPSCPSSSSPPRWPRAGTPEAGRDRIGSTRVSLGLRGGCRQHHVGRTRQRAQEPGARGCCQANQQPDRRTELGPRRTAPLRRPRLPPHPPRWSSSHPLGPSS